MDIQKLVEDLLADIAREDTRVNNADGPLPGAATARSAYKTALGRVLAATEGVHGVHRATAFERGRRYFDAAQ
jgi:hypothetical protein